MRADELRCLKLMKRQVRRIDKKGLDAPSIVSLSIAVSHALERVRTNGHEKLAALVRVRDELRDYARDLAEHVAEVSWCHQAIEEALHLLDGFVECPACHGEQGTFGPAEAWRYKRDWNDCSVCAGRGMIPKGTSEWQDEDRTYTPPEQQLDTRIDGHTARREAA